MKQSITKHRVLHIDDDQDFLDVFRLMFGKWFEIHSSECANKALKILEQENFTAIVTDYDMPEMNGLELLSIIREKMPDIPVILYTGQGNEEVAREAFIKGASDYFTKEINSFAHREKMINSISNAIQIRKAKVEKRESEEKFREITELLPQMVFETDMEGNITYANRYAFECFGYTEEDLKNGLNLVQIASPNERERARQNLSGILSGEYTGPNEYNILKKDGGTVPLLIYARLITQNNIPLGIRGIAIDITDRKHSEMLQLIQRDIGFALCEKYGMKEILSSILEAVFRVKGIDCGGIYLFDEESNDLKLMVHRGVSTKFINAISHVKKNSQLAKMVRKNEIIYSRYDEIPPLVEIIGEEEGLKAVAIIPVKYEGQILGLFNIASRNLDEFPDSVKNILETISSQISNAIVRVRAEEALKESESRLKSIFRAAPVGIGMVSHRVFTSVNRRLCDMLGYSPEELLGKNSRMIYPSQEEYDYVGYKKYSQIALHGTGTVETRFLCKDGSIIDILLSSTPIDISDLSMGVTFTALDITDWKKTEAELSKSNALFQAVFDQAPFGIQIIEGNKEHWEITMTNREAEKIFGESEEDHRGIGVEKDRVLHLERLKWTMHYPDGTLRDPVDSPLPNAMMKEIVTKNEELLIKRSDGSQTPILCNAAPIYDKNGELFGGIATLSDISEHKNFENELSKSNTLFRAIFDGVMDGILLAEVETAKLFMGNKMIHEMLGYSEQELLNLSVPDIHPEKELTYVIEQFRKLSTGEITLAHDIAVKRKDNSVFYADISASSINLNGKNYLIGMFRDVTDRNLAEKALREERDKAQKYLDIAGVIILAIDKNHKVTLINKKGCEVLGLEESEIIGKDWFENFIHIQIREKITDVFDRAMEDMEEMLEYSENSVLTADGQRRVIAWHNKIVRDDNGNITGTLSSGEDITIKRAIEKELKAEKELTEAALNSMNDTFFVLDPASGKAIRWNKAFREISGYSDEEIINMKAPDDYYDEEDISKTEKAKIDIQEKGKSLSELSLITRDGRRIPMEYIASAVKDRKDKIYIIAIGRDISDRKEMEKQLKEKNRELINFTHRVSHDLKNPINIIRGYAMALKEEPELLEQYFERIIIQADKMSEFIDKLLSLSRAGRIIGEKKSIDPESMISRVFSSLKNERFPSELIIHSPLPEFMGDPDSIEQLFTNLLDNSLKYRNPDNEKIVIEISHELKPGNILLKIKDNGIGIDGENIGKIFEPGFVLAKDKGTGFGLSIARKIAEAHGGGIRAESKGTGMGMEFIIELPG